MLSNNSTIKKLAASVKANPDDSFSKFALALEFLKRDEVNKARLFFEDIYQKDPGYVGVYYHLGKLYERIGHLGKAEKMYEEGIQIANQQNEKRTLNELEEARTMLKLEQENE